MVKPKSKQVAFDSLLVAYSKQDKTQPSIQKQICITQMETSIDIDELTLKVSFRLEPSAREFSRVKANLFFENNAISEVLIKILQGPLGVDELEYSWVLDTKGLAEGTYQLKVEMYEVWSVNERLYQTTREVTVKYVPQTCYARLIKVPFVKNATGADMVIISEHEKQLYSDMEKVRKKEQMNQRNT